MTKPSQQSYLTDHTPSATDLAVLAELRRQSEPFKGTLSAPEGRAAYDAMMEMTPGAAGVTHEQETLRGVAGVWCRVAGAREGRAILYLHGGGYGVGSAWAYRNFAGQFAARTGINVFAADYPLAPEHPFPAALDSARAAYAGLVDKGHEKILIAGDSAGGGLTLSLLAALHRAPEGMPVPVGAVAMSPWTDLTLSGSSMVSRQDEEFYLTRPVLEGFAQNYQAGTNPANPDVSPLFGNLAGLPPVQVHVGTAEILLSDSERYAEKSRQAGNAVSLHRWEAMPHVFPSSFAILDGAEQAMALMSGFIAQTLDR
ncbi:alpha/beta hydrolase [Fuscovulum blasticum]|uniref:alpha/beta hydrolase n=1 Tax=Fuscovulum blasticum TaxID=1075 RepID=UPI000D3E0F4D|nr:alpha/beta hydrolase [Fuscovulum blasticum]AWD23671.1 hypothetical protein B6K69_17725 [Fuscovulum blasticum]